MFSKIDIVHFKWVGLLEIKELENQEVTALYRLRNQKIF
jgi:hypothetical protein